MPDPRDRQPDRAALDELMRAFGDHADATVESVPIGEVVDHTRDRTATPQDASTDAAADATGAGAAGPGSDAGPVETRDDEPDQLVIVEQEPSAGPVEPAPEPPAIIRIDDDSESVVVVDDQRRQIADETTIPAGTEAPTVIAIEDDELPDAVYVAGDLEASGDRSIVFIEDDATGDTIAPDAERDVRRGIEPRMRERRAAVKRAIGRKRLRWILIVVVVVVGVVGTLAVLGSGLFAVQAENVRVFGVVYADEERVEAVVEDLVGTPTLRADTRAAEAALEAIPWVDEARVRVAFPDSATIEIREREAWTTYQGPDQRYRVLDREGRVLAVLDGYPIAYLLLAGPDPVDLEPGDFAPQGYAAASELAKNLTGSIRGQVSFVSVTADGSRLNMFLDDGTEVRFGAARDLFNKLLRLETTLANNPEREPGVIDVSTSEVTL